MHSLQFSQISLDSSIPEQRTLLQRSSAVWRPCQHNHLHSSCCEEDLLQPLEPPTILPYDRLVITEFGLWLVTCCIRSTLSSHLHLFSKLALKLLLQLAELWLVPSPTAKKEFSFIKSVWTKQILTSKQCVFSLSSWYESFGMYFSEQAPTGQYWLLPSESWADTATERDQTLHWPEAVAGSGLQLKQLLITTLLEVGDKFYLCNL